jgi:NAD(P)-dependent dehydrogenase (short-subunit alcohol dehydrogenase family)
MTDQSHSMEGKVCLVTGGTRGIGEATALGLARTGATVVIVGRSWERIERSIESVRAASANKQVYGLQADLAAQADVLRLAEAFLERYPALDVLVNNVGATVLNYQESPDGIELTWALNYLNHFLLTHLLLDVLKATAAERGEARVVEVTSSIYLVSNANLERRQQKRGYNGVLAYAQSKRAMMIFTCELARQLEGTGVTVNAVTPGFVRTGIATTSTLWARLLMRMLQPFALDLEKGVEPIVRLAGSPEMRNVSGRYYARFKQRRMAGDCQASSSGQKLWQISQNQIGYGLGSLV